MPSGSQFLSVLHPPGLHHHTSRCRYVRHCYCLGVWEGVNLKQSSATGKYFATRAFLFLVGCFFLHPCTADLVLTARNMSCSMHTGLPSVTCDTTPAVLIREARVSTTKRICVTHQDGIGKISARLFPGHHFRDRHFLWCGATEFSNFVQSVVSRVTYR